MARRYLDNTQTIDDGTQLRPVVVRPEGYNDEAKRMAKEMFKGRLYRRKMIKELNSPAQADAIDEQDYRNYTADNMSYDPYGRIHRMYDLYKASGSPRINRLMTFKNKVRRFFNKDYDNRAYYVGPQYSNKGLHVDEEIPYRSIVSDYVAELAHAYQDTNSYYDNEHTGEFHSISRYDVPNTKESTAHRIIEPAMYGYLTASGPAYNIPFSDVLKGYDYRNDVDRLRMEFPEYYEYVDSAYREGTPMYKLGGKTSNKKKDYYSDGDPTELKEIVVTPDTDTGFTRIPISNPLYDIVSDFPKRFIMSKLRVPRNSRVARLIFGNPFDYIY